MTSSSTKQLIINKFSLPQDIINIIKNYLFYKIGKILKTDERYDLLLTIPCKSYDCIYGIYGSSVRMVITNVKYLVMSYGEDRLGGKIELYTFEHSHNAKFCTDYKVNFIV